jgi:hypothetical protein
MAGEFKTDRLRAAITSGLASPNRWKVDLPSLQGMRKVRGEDVGTYTVDFLDVVCTNARLPGRNIRTLDRTIGGVTTRAAAGFEAGSINLSFFLDQDYILKKYFQDWMDCVISPRPPYEAGFYDRYKRDIKVSQLDKKETTIYRVNMIGCYPTSVQEVELNNQAQTAPLELVVTMFYKNYEVEVGNRGPQGFSGLKTNSGRV